MSPYTEFDDTITGQRLVTDRSERPQPNQPVAHYGCATDAKALGKYTHFLNNRNAGTVTTGVCEYCKQTFYTVNYELPPESAHFI